MNRLNVLFFILLLSVGSPINAQVRDNPDLLAARGDGEVTHGNFEARVNRIPPELQFRVIRDRTRMDDILNNLLIDAQLAEQAYQAGFDKDPVVMERLALAVREELARAWIESIVDSDRPADYTTLAREKWQANRGDFMTPESVDVAHILIGFDDRSEAEALTLTKEIETKLTADPSQFAELARSYSDDKGSRSRGGVYKAVKRGDMVEPFENAAFNMEVGSISEPVLTQYGYHIIRLDSLIPSQQQPFEAVQLTLEQQVRQQHRERKRGEALNPLYAEEIEVTRESVTNSIRRVFGEEVLAEFTGENETQ